MDPEAALRRLGGVARNAELTRLGVARHRLLDARRRGRVRRVMRGVYALPDASQRVVAAAVVRGSLGCISACKQWGLPLVDDPVDTHVVVAQHRSMHDIPDRALRSTRVHRAHGAAPSMAIELPSDSIDQAAWCLDPLGQLALLDGALRLGRVPPSAAASFRRSNPRRRAWLEAHQDAQSGSLPETFARVALLSAGLEVDSQVDVPDVGRVDFIVDGGLIVEVDGYAEHSKRPAFQRDRIRDRNALRAGLRTVRFTYWDCVGNLEELAETVCALVDRAPDARLTRRLAWARRTPGQ